MLLKIKFSNQEIPQLFNNGGVQRSGDSGVFNICMKWNLDETGTINGIFIRVILKDNFAVWIKPDSYRNTHNFIWIQDGFVYRIGARVNSLGYLPDILKYALSGHKTAAKPPQFEVKNLDQTAVNTLAEFFNKARHVLPQHVRAHIYPSHLK